jgi:Ca2+-binding RTX toxin-like protein
MAALAVAAGWALAAAPPAEASFTCGYDAATKHVTADLDASASISAGLVAQDGLIAATQTSGADQCGEATVANTDTIAVKNVTPGGALPGDYHLELPSDLFGGATDEPGDSDEIELAVELGPGRDSFRLRPGPDSEHTDPSEVSLGAAAGGEVQVNVNAGETRGIDNDIVVNGADYLDVESNDGDDAISGDGAAPGAEAPFADPLYVGTSGGADAITGGSGDDLLYGEEGPDRAAGGLGDDYINGGFGDDSLAGDGGNDRIKGADGNDVIRGGAGDDLLRDHRGDDLIVGGAGHDICIDGDGDARFRGCEVERSS